MRRQISSPLAQPICGRERLGRHTTAFPYFSSVEQHQQHGNEDGYAEQPAGAHPKSAIANGEAMTGNRNHHSAKSEQKRERQFKVENKKANMVLIIASAIGALILSVAALA